MSNLMMKPIIPLPANNLEYKYIWSARVLDNKDPLMLNRIRVYFETQIDGRNNQSILDSVPDRIESKNTKTDDKSDLLPEFKWSKFDPFCFLPLLPIFLKVTPKKGEYVNILWPNPNSKFSEQYYIQGTFSSPLTMFNEDSQSSRMFATRDRITNSKLLRNPDNYEYYYKSSKGVFAEPDDISIIGRGTCDIIIKNNDLLLRAGRSTKNPDNRNTNISAKKNRSFIQLSDFSNRIIDLGNREANRLEQNVQYVKTLIEWNIINPENQYNKFGLEIFLYRLPQKKEYTTINLQKDTVVNYNDKALVTYLSFSATSLDEVVNHVNTFIKQVNDGEINIPPFPIKPVDNQFPCVFKASQLTYRWLKDSTNTSSAEYLNISKMANQILFKGEKKDGFGLIFSRNVTGQQQAIKKEVLKEFDYQSTPTTYNILGGDKLLLLSHESKIPSKSQVVLNTDTIAGISQDYLVQNVLSNTDPMVRGDELMKFLNLVVRFLTTHVHAFPGLPPVPISSDGTSSAQILVDLQNASNTILNQNLRIN